MPEHKRQAFYSADGHIDIDIGPHSDSYNNSAWPALPLNNNKDKDRVQADEEACQANLGSTAAGAV